MDSARTAPPPPPPPPPRHPHLPPHQYQPHTYASHPSTPVSTQPVVGPAPSHSALAPSVDPRAQSPYSQHQPQPHPHLHSSAPPPYPHTYPSHEPQYTQLPPIHHNPSASAQHHTQEQGGSLPPPFRGQSSSTLGISEEAREQSDHRYHSQHNRSGDATPAPVNQRSYSHDHSAHQRTPSTPVQSGPYPLGPGPEQAQAASKPMDHVMQQQYGPSNGVHHPPPPPPPPPGYHGGPTQDTHGPYSAGPVMDSHVQHSMHQHPQHMYHQPSYGPSSYAAAGAMNKRKPMRAQQACEQCRQRKQKCDEGTPCSFCKEQGMNCTYRDTPPAKVDKNSEKILTAIQEMASKLDGMVAAHTTLATRVGRLEDSREPQPSGIQVVDSADEEYTAEEYTSHVFRQRDHRTGPHKLISLWPTMKLLFDDTQIPHENYVTQAEDRGPIRIHGRGEGIDEQDGTHPHGGPASPARSDDASSDNAPTPREGIWGRGFPNVNTGSYRPLSLAGGLKADGSLDLDSTTIRALWESYFNHIHCMHPFLDMKRTKRNIDIFISYYSPDVQNSKRINVGFVAAATYSSREMETDRPSKRQRTEVFTRTSPSASGLSTASNSSNQAGASAMNAEYNYASLPPPSTTSNGDLPTKNPITNERSPTNAVIFLILALGKICQHSEDLPGVAADNAAAKNTIVAQTLVGNPGFSGSSPSNNGMKQSPCSPKLTPMMQNTPSDSGVYKTEAHSRSRRSSHDGTADGPVKNIERIPGLAYYAKAAELLGDHGDGNQIVHAQMFLLAALYKGQLARVKESMAWLAKAGLVCQSLIDRHGLYKAITREGQLTPDELRKVARHTETALSSKSNLLIVLASWTCLQLESDILAELKLPSSGIQSIERLMLVPGGLTTDDAYEQEPRNRVQQDNEIMQYYISQIFLRRRLNDVHQELYGSQLANMQPGVVRGVLLSYESTLEQWRSTLQPALSWEDDDKAPSDILNARLRAKFYGALYVSTRPFLDYALHIMPFLRQGKSLEACAVDANGKRREATDILIFKAIAQMSEQDIWEKVRKCVNAALKSTVAFDSVPARLIVTNIHGTAHAQFGNMLVLAAAYHTPWLGGIVSEKHLREKMERTIKFLRRLKNISPTCRHDVAYLERIQQKLFLAPDEVKSVYQSETEPRSATTSFSH